MAMDFGFGRGYNEERNKKLLDEMRGFWAKSAPEQQREMCSVDKHSVLKELRQRHRHNCNCPTCGKRRPMFDSQVKMFEEFINNLQAGLQTIDDVEKIEPILPFGCMLQMERNSITVGSPFFNDSGARFSKVMKWCAKLYPEDLSIPSGVLPYPSDFTNFVTRARDFVMHLSEKINANIPPLFERFSDSDSDVSDGLQSDDEGDDESDDDRSVCCGRSPELEVSALLEPWLFFQFYIARLFVHNVRVRKQALDAKSHQAILIKELVREEEADRARKQKKKENRQKAKAKKKERKDAAEEDEGEGGESGDEKEGHKSKKAERCEEEVETEHSRAEADEAQRHREEQEKERRTEERRQREEEKKRRRLEEEQQKQKKQAKLEKKAAQAQKASEREKEREREAAEKNQNQKKDEKKRKPEQQKAKTEEPRGQQRGQAEKTTAQEKFDGEWQSAPKKGGKNAQPQRPQQKQAEEETPQKQPQAPPPVQKKPTPVQQPPQQQTQPQPQPQQQQGGVPLGGASRTNTNTQQVVSRLAGGTQPQTLSTQQTQHAQQPPQQHRPVPLPTGAHTSTSQKLFTPQEHDTRPKPLHKETITPPQPSLQQSPPQRTAATPAPYQPHLLGTGIPSPSRTNAPPAVSSFTPFGTATNAGIMQSQMSSPPTHEISSPSPMHASTPPPPQVTAKPPQPQLAATAPGFSRAPTQTAPEVGPRDMHAYAPPHQFQANEEMLDVQTLLSKLQIGNGIAQPSVGNGKFGTPSPGSASLPSASSAPPAFGQSALQGMSGWPRSDVFTQQFLGNSDVQDAVFGSSSNVQLPWNSTYPGTNVTGHDQTGTANPSLRHSTATGPAADFGLSTNFNPNSTGNAFRGSSGVPPPHFAAGLVDRSATGGGQVGGFLPPQMLSSSGLNAHAQAYNPNAQQERSIRQQQSPNWQNGGSAVDGGSEIGLFGIQPNQNAASSLRGLGVGDVFGAKSLGENLDLAHHGVGVWHQNQNQPLGQTQNSNAFFASSGMVGQGGGLGAGSHLNVSHLNGTGTGSTFDGTSLLGNSSSGLNSVGLFGGDFWRGSPNEAPPLDLQAMLRSLQAANNP